MKSFNENWDGIQRKTLSEAELTKVGYALVVDNKIIYRGSKQQCLKKAKEHGGLKMGKVFVTLTPKNIGQPWQKEEVELDESDVPLDKKFMMKGSSFQVRKAIDGKGYTLYAVGRGGSGLRVVGKVASLDKNEVLKAAEEANKKAASDLLSSLGFPSIRKEETLVSEAADLGRYWTDLDDMATNIQKATTNVAWVGKFDVHSYLLQIVGSLRQKHAQQRDFLQGLIYSLEAVHKKTMSPSKHGNMEIMKDLSTVIRELKKYQK
jgi:hypothetical protein